MLSVDFHTHTHFSNCGVHTHLEMLTRARELGMSALTFADHGPELKGKINSIVFERFKDPLPGIKALKGMECNLTATRGIIDLPADYLKWLDVVLVGLHHNTPKYMGKEAYTSLLVGAIENNPGIDIITHPNDSAYPVDYPELADCARRHGVILEANNSKIALGRSTTQEAATLINACKKTGCKMAITSDAHTLSEIGRDESILPVIKKCAFPADLLISRDAKTALAFVEERRSRKNQDLIF